MADTVVSRGLDVERIRVDFPILQRRIRDEPLVYLDSAATSQKPSAVLEAVDDYYRTSNANVHRGVHTLASEATDLYELARQRVARFIDAAPEGIVFVRNTTEALNLVASSFARELLSPGDRIVLTVSEHHSNLVPWQLAATSRKWRDGHTPRASWSASTQLSRCRTCRCRCGSSTSISLLSAATRCAVPWASASSGHDRSCWSACRRSSQAEA
jgi:hypothetical protein